MKLIRSLALTGALAAGIAGPAFASLGGNVDSVQSDGVHMKSAVRVTPSQGYAIHEMQSPGTVLREFVGADGRVFAVSWHGPSNPDLRQVLGSYYANYEQGIGRHPPHPPPGGDLPGGPGLPEQRPPARLHWPRLGARSAAAELLRRRHQVAVGAITGISMRKLVSSILAASLALLAACGGGGGTSTGPTPPAQVIASPGPPNVEPIYVDAGPAALSVRAVNIPYVTLTICQPGTTTCQTIDHIEVDTGSSGLRILSRC